MDESIQPLALRSREAAKVLSISPRTLWGLTHPRGPIRACKLGPTPKAGVLYTLEELRRWLASQLAARDDDGVQGASNAEGGLQ